MFECLTFKDINALVVRSSGKHWLCVLDAIKSSELDGEMIADYMESPKSLASLFEALQCPINPIIAKQLYRRICKAAHAKSTNNDSLSNTVQLGSDDTLQAALREKVEQIAKQQKEMTTLASELQAGKLREYTQLKQQQKELIQQQEQVTAALNAITMADSYDELKVDDSSTFMCPITSDLMHDPVICPEGHSFERKVIEEWLDHKKTNPVTRQYLTKDMLTPNRALRDSIDLYRHRLLAAQKQKAQRTAEIIKLQQYQGELVIKKKQIVGKLAALDNSSADQIAGTPSSTIVSPKANMQNTDSKSVNQGNSKPRVSQERMISQLKERKEVNDIANIPLPTQATDGELGANDLITGGQEEQTLKLEKVLLENNYRVKQLTDTEDEQQAQPNTYKSNNIASHNDEHGNHAALLLQSKQPHQVSKLLQKRGEQQANVSTTQPPRTLPTAASREASSYILKAKVHAMQTELPLKVWKYIQLLEKKIEILEKKKSRPHKTKFNDSSCSSVSLQSHGNQPLHRHRSHPPPTITVQSVKRLKFTSHSQRQIDRAKLNRERALRLKAERQKQKYGLRNS